MKKSKIEKIIVFILMNIFIISGVLSQKIVTKSKLVIKHTDMTLYLTSDTNTMVSVQELTYDNFLKIGKVNRDSLGDKWFDDTFKGKFKLKYYIHTGYDKGHLTPFKSSSYSVETAIFSFSSYNQAPHDDFFNEHTWEQLERSILDTIGKYKLNATIITGVIYNKKPTYLSKSKIKIPIYYYKVLFIGNKRYYWLGDNKKDFYKKGDKIPISSLEELNKLFKSNKMDVKITLNIK